jgi:hypothetical protein
VTPQSPILLLTGIPRSGTTLTASLMNGLDAAVCLHEPPQFRSFCLKSGDRAEFVGRCLDELKELRRSLLNGMPVLDRRNADGSYPTNYFDKEGQRTSLVEVAVRPESAYPNLLLAVKHNEVFTSILPELVQCEGLNIIAVVRHPVPTMLSWLSRTIPLSRGHLVRAYRFWDEAVAIEKAGGSVPDVQAKIYELYCGRYWAHRDRITVIKYEDIVDNPGVLEQVTGRKLTNPPGVSPRNLNTERRDLDIGEMKVAMAKHFDNACHFYQDLDRW